MALLQRSHRHDEVSHPGTDRMVDEQRSTSTGDGWNSALRLVGAIAGGVATVIGIVALIRISWTDGLDSAPVDVVGMAFTPVVAIATTVLGLVALVAGAAADRGSKFVIGGLLACLGVAILIAGDSRTDWDLEAGHGWLALIVGAVLVASGLLMRQTWTTRRTVREEGYRA